jgi:hypothetical protein
MQGPDSGPAVLWIDPAPAEGPHLLARPGHGGALCRSARQTWSERRSVFSRAMRAGSTYGHLIVLSDGTALPTMYGERGPAWEGHPTEEDPKGTRMGAQVVSRGRGAWEDFTVVAPTGHHEIGLFALSDQCPIVMCRSVHHPPFSGRGSRPWHGNALCPAEDFTSTGLAPAGVDVRSLCGAGSLEGSSGSGRRAGVQFRASRLLERPLNLACRRCGR